jgi:signal transduction histidine kinase
VAHVVILGDRPGDRRLLVDLLTRHGHAPVEAATGDEALEAIRASRIDMVVTAILMPEMDGYEFVRRLRADPEIHQPRVVFYTAVYLLEEARALAAACGVSHVLVKPAEPDAIMATLEQALREDPSGPPVAGKEYDREHLAVLNHKLFEKVEELHAVNLERRRLLADLVTAQETERARIAGEIHDDSIQVMAAAALRLDLIGRRLEDAGERDALDQVGLTVAKAIRRLRRLMFDLRPRSLDTGGLPAALGAYLRETRVDGDPEWRLDDRLGAPLDEQATVILYRIAQEALRNARKHAGAAVLDVVFERRDGGVLLRVTDDGVGCDAEQAVSYRPGHLGLLSMRERAEIAGGWMRFESTPGGGATVEAWIPETVTEGLTGVAEGAPTMGDARSNGIR